MRRKIDGVPAALAGAIFGVALWKASFEGWMPALGIMPATTGPPMKKRPPDIVGHVVYGAATAVSYETLQKV